MFAFFAGLAAGLLHVFSGPDHLAAVAPLAAERADRSRRFESKVAHRPAVGPWPHGRRAADRGAVAVLREQLPLDAHLRLTANASSASSLIAVGCWGRVESQRSAASGRTRTPARRLRWARFTALPAARICSASCRRSRSQRATDSFCISPASASARSRDDGLCRRHGSARRAFGSATITAAIAVCLYASSAAALVIGGFWLVGR